MSWCSGWASPFMLTLFCHLQKLRRVLSAWCVIFRSSWGREGSPAFVLSTKGSGEFSFTRRQEQRPEGQWGAGSQPVGWHSLWSDCPPGTSWGISEAVSQVLGDSQYCQGQQCPLLHPPPRGSSGSGVGALAANAPWGSVGM